MTTLAITFAVLWALFRADPWSAAPSGCTENGGQCDGCARADRTVA